MATKAYHIPNGPKNLETLFPSINFSQLSHYYIEVLDSDGDVVATSPINQLGGCCEDDKVRIHFLNRLGGIDAINFKLLNEEHEAKSDGFEKPIQYPLVKSEHGGSRLNVKSNDTFKAVNTTYSENEKNWLEELFDSPLAWMEWEGTEGQDDSYIPVIIKDVKFDKVKEEDRFNYEVTIEFILSHEKFNLRN